MVMHAFKESPIETLPKGLEFKTKTLTSGFWNKIPLSPDELRPRTYVYTSLSKVCINYLQDEIVNDI